MLVKRISLSLSLLLVLFCITHVLIGQDSRSMLKIDFENVDDRAYKLQDSKITEDLETVLVGKKSLYFDGQKPWSEFFRTEAKSLPLEPKKTYKISITYKMLGTAQKGGKFYTLFRAASQGTKADVGMTMKPFTTGVSGVLVTTVELKDFPDYQMIIGTHLGGTIVIDEVVIEKVLPLVRPLAPLTEYHQIWADEFNEPGRVSSSNWNIKRGFRTKEEEQYCTDKPENLRVENGCLVMEVRQEKIENAFYTAKGDWMGNDRKRAEYTSGYVDSKGKFDFKYGRIEVRAKFSVGSGSWPAIWAMGDWKKNGASVGWPACGEIDVLEYIGVEPKNIHATVHFSDNGSHASKGNILETTNPEAEFHNYICEWTPEFIYFYFDDLLIGSFESKNAIFEDENPFQKPFYLILNNAIGGWGGKVDVSALPNRFLVDYARVYQRN